MAARWIKRFDISRNVVDAKYLELLKIKLIAGRSFTDNRKMENHNFILKPHSSFQA